MQSKRWVFTLNNPTSTEVDVLKALETSDDVRYITWGNETGESGTPHLQGFVIFNGSKRLRAVKRILGNRVHAESARGTSQQARDYCHKDGDFIEFGSFPDRQGKRSDLDDAIEWADAFMAEHKRPLTAKDIAVHQPSIAIKYPRFINVLQDRYEHEPLVDVASTMLRPWQQDLSDILEGEPDDRTIHFIIDTEGNKGKTFFARYYLSKFPEKVQILAPCKRDDMAYMVDPSKSIFIVNVPRGSMEYVQFSVLEMLKDRLVVSPKYMSTLKRLMPCHVVVMTNEQVPDNRISDDRISRVVL